MAKKLLLLPRPTTYTAKQPENKVRRTKTEKEVEKER